ncbi:hypothetical protein [Xanthomonas axonopodis]|uniref:hypothetical protein n=1 Tax=Xanthomonas axonopodis TaxID=53413 RepID=UPI0035578AB1
MHIHGTLEIENIESKDRTSINGKDFNLADGGEEGVPSDFEYTDEEGNFTITVRVTLDGKHIANADDITFEGIKANIISNDLQITHHAFSLKDVE